MRSAGSQHRTTLRIFGFSVGERVSSLLSAVVVIAATIVLFSAPGKVMLQYGEPGSKDATLYTAGFGPWGARASLAAIAALAGLALATSISDRWAGGWPALGTVVSAGALVWIADYGRDFQNAWRLRAATATEYEVVAFGPSGWAADIAAAGAIAAIALAVWTLRRGLADRQSLG